MEKKFIFVCKSVEVGNSYISSNLYEEDSLSKHILHLNSIGVLVDKVIEVSFDDKLNCSVSNYEY